MKQLNILACVKPHCATGPSVSRWAGVVALCLLTLTASAGNSGDQQRNLVGDPLDTPTVVSDAKRRSAIGIAKAGERLVAVGRRGMIQVSDNNGESWKQVPSPVSTDFTSVQFINAQNGWIVGHDGIVLHSRDGGASWERKLDGRGLLKLLSAYYESRSKAGDKSVDAILDDITRAAAQSATPDVLPYPLLDVWFSDEKNGFVVGAFGLILNTTDGGASWTPWNDRTGNERMQHIYAVKGNGVDLYLAGEQGFLRRLNASNERFEPMESPYQGSFFGMTAHGARLAIYGLRGNAYTSTNAGKSWQKVETAVAANIVAALPVKETGLLFISQAGHVLYQDGENKRAEPLSYTASGELYGAVMAGRQLVTVGFAGITSAVPAATPQ